jgi:hypothetical protein
MKEVVNASGTFAGPAFPGMMLRGLGMHVRKEAATGLFLQRTLASRNRARHACRKYAQSLFSTPIRESNNRATKGDLP